MSKSSLCSNPSYAHSNPSVTNILETRSLRNLWMMLIFGCNVGFGFAYLISYSIYHAFENIFFYPFS